MLFPSFMNDIGRYDVLPKDYQITTEESAKFDHQELYSHTNRRSRHLLAAVDVTVDVFTSVRSESKPSLLALS